MSLRRILLLVLIGLLSNCGSLVEEVQGIVVVETNPPHQQVVLVTDQGVRHVLLLSEEDRARLIAQAPVRLKVWGQRGETTWMGRRHPSLRVWHWEVVGAKAISGPESPR